MTALFSSETETKLSLAKLKFIYMLLDLKKDDFSQTMPIQLITDWHDSCRLKRQLETVRTVTKWQHNCRQLPTITDMYVFC